VFFWAVFVVDAGLRTFIASPLVQPAAFSSWGVILLLPNAGNREQHVHGAQSRIAGFNSRDCFGNARGDCRGRCNVSLPFVIQVLLFVGLATAQVRDAGAKSRPGFRLNGVIASLFSVRLFAQISPASI
jgi:hypothetical protein